MILSSGGVGSWETHIGTPWRHATVRLINRGAESGLLSPGAKDHGLQFAGFAPSPLLKTISTEGKIG